MTLEDELAQLRATNVALQAEVARLQTALAAAEAQLHAALAALAAAPDDPPDPPAPPPFVKPNTPAGPKRPRAKRAPAHNRARRRLLPTEIRTCAYDACPTCAYPLTGVSVARRREVLDLPPPPPVRVIEYQVLKRYCPHCARWQEPELQLDGVVVGHGRLGVRILALVAWLHTVLRLPLRQIQTYLAALHQLPLSVGELSAILTTVTTQGAPAVAAIKAALQASPVLHLDETSWRENGQNGYVWVMTNAEGLAYFHYDRSRAGAVARGLTGAHFAGTLCSDFYSGYNEHACRHQRCWAHLLRDLAELEQTHATQEEVTTWVQAVRRLYTEGVRFGRRAPPPSTVAREAKAAELRVAAHGLGLRWAQAKAHPTHALCQRLLRHEGELFEFVRQAEVEATNNRAERAIRPLAVARKISGGTRSAMGSQTRMRLQTLFTTWAAKGWEPLEACGDMLRAKPLLPSF